jgi:hypothetical protein
MGELCSLMPVVHPYAGGAVGKGHGDDYYISDPYKSCVLSAKWQLAMLIMLLENGACLAKEIIKNFKPGFSSKEEYFDYIDKINSSGARIEYNENGTITVNP